MEIITARPEGMLFEDYKALRKLQNITLRRRKKGKIVWLSKLYPTKNVMQFLKDSDLQGKESLGRLLVKGESYVKPKKDV